jgi:flagellar biosynthesis anti-sigma factor FlgM
MKIDPRIQFPEDSRSGEVKGSAKGTSAKKSSTSSGVSSPSGEDTVQLSATHSEVRTLEAGLTQVPEVRVHRVKALQQRVQSGQFQPDSQKVADALIADHSKQSSRV